MPFTSHKPPTQMKIKEVWCKPYSQERISYSPEEHTADCLWLSVIRRLATYRIRTNKNLFYTLIFKSQQLLFKQETHLWLGQLKAKEKKNIEKVKKHIKANSKVFRDMNGRTGIMFDISCNFGIFFNLLTICTNKKPVPLAL